MMVAFSMSSCFWEKPYLSMELGGGGRCCVEGRRKGRRVGRANIDWVLRPEWISKTQFFAGPKMGPQSFIKNGCKTNKTLAVRAKRHKGKTYAADPS